MKRTSKYDDIHKEAVKHRSITPESYRGGEFKITEVDTSESEKSEQELFYIDEYKYKDSVTSHVMHFGINTYIEGLAEEISKHNKAQKEISESKFTSNTNNHKAISQNTSLTKHEKLIVEKALNYLKENNLKTVLVDVFERDKSGIVSSLETHTAVLYNNGTNDKMFVIDPSNPQFSSHIANFHPSIQVDYSDKMKIYQPPEKANEKGLIGSKRDQWRDCVDIAVKIAFGLNKSPVLNDFKAIISSEAVQTISNSYKINDSIPDEIQDKSFIKIPFRIQQKSNLKITEDLYKFSKTVKQNLIEIVEKTKLENGYFETLFDSDKNLCTKVLENLYCISEGTFSQLHKELEEKQLEVLGKGFTPDIYDEA